MTNTSRKVMIACYGGGHVQSLIPLARALAMDSSVELTVMGFTTASAAFERAGIKTTSYTVLESYLEYPCSDLIEPYIKDMNHPEIAPEETRAYFHVGLHDLIIENGQEVALKKLNQYGRKSFMPVNTFKRYLEANPQDLVITSTSPRSELALQRAALGLGIQGLAVSDLFLQHEAAYLCDGHYAKNISVIADYVARLLVDAGCNCDQIYVTGNPAFDSLFSEESREAGHILRKTLNLSQDDRLITWIGTPSDVSIRGKPFVANESVINKLELYCKTHPATKFAFRPHPNRPFIMPAEVGHGYLLDGQYSIEAVLWASDVVLLETSTVGLQAALIGKPVITIAAENYPPYAQLGLAKDVPDLDSIDSVLDEPPKPNLNTLGPKGLGDACQHVLDLVNDLLVQNVHYERV